MSKELNEKLAKWVNFHRAPVCSCGSDQCCYRPWFDARGTGVGNLPNFTGDLNAIYKWLTGTDAGRFWCSIAGPYTYDGTYEATVAYGGGHSRNHQVLASDKDPAMALCLAIEKMINMETKL